MTGANSSAAAAFAEAISGHAWLLLAIMLILSSCESSDPPQESPAADAVLAGMPPCDEIYVVREGETLNSISDKCGDPYIVEENPHIHDPDDVFPGLVIKITPLKRYFT